MPQNDSILCLMAAATASDKSSSVEADDGGVATPPSPPTTTPTIMTSTTNAAGSAANAAVTTPTTATCSPAANNHNNKFYHPYLPYYHRRPLTSPSSNGAGGVRRRRGGAAVAAAADTAAVTATAAGDDSENCGGGGTAPTAQTHVLIHHHHHHMLTLNAPPQPWQTSGAAEQPPENAIVADKYLLLEQAEGSSLYRCVDIHTQQELVCKIVSKDCHSLVSAHYRLNGHARIAALHEVVVGQRHLYLMYAKAHGDLHSYVRHRRRLRESEAKRLFRQIAETVQICHQHGIVLRDLKLRKFVFTDDDRVDLKLESLEDAVVLEEPNTDWLHDKRGCPAYVSPEILRAGAHYSGKAADMWSLGVILYTMLVGRYPFNDSEHASLFAKISRGFFIIPECLSVRSRCLIRSLLRRDPSERLTSDDIMYHPWLTKEEPDWTPRVCDQLVPECDRYAREENATGDSADAAAPHSNNLPVHHQPEDFHL